MAKHLIVMAALITGMFVICALTAQFWIAALLFVALAIYVLWLMSRIGVD